MRGTCAITQVRMYKCRHVLHMADGHAKADGHAADGHVADGHVAVDGHSADGGKQKLSP